MSTNYCGRFAPSPTGDLHFGSLVAAVGSYAQALVNQGQWLLRIEDIDPARERKGAAKRQIEDLNRFGLTGTNTVDYQSRHRQRHEQVIEDWLGRGLAFECGCSRSELPASGIYPGTCRNGLPPGKHARSIRFRVPDREIEFYDAIHGRQHENLVETSGDFVIRRADGLIAYQLAVVVDDADDGITEVVRGADLLNSTARQILLWRTLGIQPPKWVHVPLIVDASGQKLSKSSRADPV
ncbi:MAG: tRNA glutamyl-Q(34) synthetase GluQRS, partial [Pseudomonadota bacterium]